MTGERRERGGWTYLVAAHRTSTVRPKISASRAPRRAPRPPAPELRCVRPNWPSVGRSASPPPDLHAAVARSPPHRQICAAARAPSPSLDLPSSSAAPPGERSSAEGGRKPSPVGERGEGDAME
uniref:Uncharacterized protein n=1 Tax=Oryza brachyantha TaxID=4533 RepID=J3KVQ5_ORYBR